MAAEQKHCSRCDKARPITDFGADRSRSDGRYPYCDECRRSYGRKYHAANRVRRSGHAKASRARHAERINANRRARYADDPEPTRQRNLESWWRHRDRRLAAAAAYYLEHSEEAKKRAADWKRANPARARELSRLYARRRALDRDEDALSFADILRRDPCSYCGEPTEHIDHIDPVAFGGSNAWDNLTGACASCNTRKHTKPLLLFLATRP